MKQFNRTIFIALGLCLTTTLSPLQSTAKLKKGESFPQFNFPLLKEGESNLDFKSLKGKVVYVDFWASWCEPCKISFPQLDKIYKKYKDKGVEIVGINLDETRDEAKGFLKKHPVSFPIVYAGSTDKLVGQLELDGMPSAFLIDANGKVKLLKKGFVQGDAEKLENELKNLVKN